MHLSIKKSSFGTIKIKNLVLFWMWWYMLITPIIIYWGGLPRMFLYIGDVVGCGVLCLFLRSIFVYKGRTYITSAAKGMLVLYLIFGTISAISNGVKPLNYLWGMRNCVRLFLFFAAAAMYLSTEDFLKTRRIVTAVFWISLPLCWYETYMISYPVGTIVGDMVGGLYHGFNGVTMPLNVILILESTAILNDYLQNRIKLPRMLVTLLAAVVMSGWAELKVFIVELVIIVAVQMLISKKGIKSVLIVVLGILAFSYIVTFFTEVNARGRTTYGDIFTIKGFMEYISRNTGYDGVGDLNRIGGIKTLNDGLFKGDWLQHIMGLGIGSAEYTNFFVSPFYERYSYLHYSWFQMIWVYIENGYIGVVSMFFFLSSQIVDAYRTIEDKWLRNFTVSVSVLMPVLFFYNVTLRNEVVGFYLYFILALPCIYRKEKLRKCSEEN